jgi:hypothetical protein
MMEATPVEGSDARVLGTNDYKDTAPPTSSSSPPASRASPA